ncbi:MAG: efflux RND transporter permease subunit [Methyloceanibacter sp.]|nr:efflux RND transporter permease subunit [Methyloceanibacter sp.]
MKLAHFFIDRPIFAISLSIAIVIFGLVAMFRLPISQYPEVVPPTVIVTANYPGASAETIARTVATPIEQEINGVDNMLYMYSNSTNDGEMRLTVTFALGTDLDDAQVLVQNRVALAEPRLPGEVRRTGVSVRKNSPDFLLVIQMFSPDQSRDQLFVSNYSKQRVEPVLQRLPGVGSITALGSRDYSMRVWLDPNKIADLQLTPGEVVEAIQSQNTQVAGGQLAQPPVATDRAFQPTISLRGRLDDVSEFEDIIIKRGDEGRIARLGDIARVELGAENYRTNAYFDGKPYVPLLVFQQPGANAIETAREVKSVMAELAEEFPAGIAYDSTYNPTEFFIETSIKKLTFTIYEAVALVMLVILVFLQNFRASFIPLMSIPVSLIGTFLVMSALGYNINTLTLFGIILAVGIVVDDAIIVVENVERNLRKGLSRRDATRQSMSEITVALISNGLVLAAVFIPTMLLDGISGEFFRQFAVAITVATLLSVFNSLTLSPALTALFLDAHDASREKNTWSQKLSAPLHHAGSWSNRAFARFNEGYGKVVTIAIARKYLVLAAFATLTGGAVALTLIVPRGFIPAADQGYAIVAVQLPAGSSLARTDAVMVRMVKDVKNVDGVTYTHSFPGFYGLTGTTNSATGTLFVQFEDFDTRAARGRHGSDVISDLRASLAPIDDAIINVIQPPTIRGIGTGGGFTLRVQDYEAQGSVALSAATSQFLSALNAHPDIQFAFTPFNVSAPDYFVDVDREQAEMLRVPVQRVHEMLEVYLGSVYINDFNVIGRTYQVRAQAEGDYRLDIEQLAELRTRSETGQMVPLGSIATIEAQSAPDRAPRYNLFGTAEVIGGASLALSSDQTLSLVEKIAEETLPQGFGIEWTDLSYQQRVTQDGTILFVLSIVFVFLVLASQYESLRLPFAVILIVPMVLLSALGGLYLMGMDNNILTQIALIVLIGLAAKNAILIVEFARQLEDQGYDTVHAAIEASRLRLRPILMTSLAFTLGVVPLMTAEGAGAELREALGTAVFFGMLGVTIFGLIFTPVFYVVARQLGYPYASTAHSTSVETTEA